MILISLVVIVVGVVLHWNRKHTLDNSITLRSVKEHNGVYIKDGKFVVNENGKEYTPRNIVLTVKNPTSYQEINKRFRSKFLHYYIGSLTYDELTINLKDFDKGE